VFKCTSFVLFPLLSYVDVCIAFWISCVLGLMVSAEKRVQFYFRNLVHCVEYFVTMENVRVNAVADILYSCRLHAHRAHMAY
jgi:hypothetical protein